ncbi:MAG: type II toxin-antitoxin system RelE/ParE family toxin [Bifidobacteriaceae bacterium]|nr:type II toxin-antitoxin system RelE/ParE family toxin [Bifidobacteriaceae bacterium]
MIRGFVHKGLEDFYSSGSKRGIIPEHAGKLRRILSVLDVAQAPRDLSIPSFRLHPLKGLGTGRWAVSVSGNWRVTFEFDRGQVDLVDYLDYH